MKEEKRWTGQWLIWILVFLLVLTSDWTGGISQVMASSETESQNETEKTGEQVEYIAFGDSIPNGYVAPGEDSVVSYPHLLAMDIEEIGTCKTELSMYTKNGLTLRGLYKKYLSEPEVEEKIRTADVITVTIGSNDLLNEFESVSQEILNMEERPEGMSEAVEALQEGVAENPILLLRIGKAIGSWDYDTFETRWETVMGKIQKERKSDAQVVVTTIYNPVAKRELPGTLNAVVESVISRMNDIILEHGEEYGYQVADLFSVGVEMDTQSDGLHPNQEGNNLIKEAIESQLDFDVFLQMTKEAEKAIQQQKEKVKQAQKEKRNRIWRRRIRWIGTIVLVLVCLLWFHFHRKKKKAAKKSVVVDEQPFFHASHSKNR